MGRRKENKEDFNWVEGGDESDKVRERQGRDRDRGDEKDEDTKIRYG